MKFRLGPLGAPAAIVLAWVAVRVAVLMPQPDEPRMARQSPHAARSASNRPAMRAPESAGVKQAASQPRRAARQAPPHALSFKGPEARLVNVSPTPDTILTAKPAFADPSRSQPVFQGRRGVVAGYSPPQRPPHHAVSGSGWVLVNGTGGAVGVPSLGGSQTGLRLFLQGAGAPLALTARVSRALGAPHDTEVSAGYGLRARGLGLLVERRQRLDVKSGAFVVTGYGGVYDVRLPAELRFDGFAQGGVAGLRQRRWFTDGQARVTGRARLSSDVSVGVGGGVWASAQPGARRVELGPLAEARWRTGAAGLRVAGEYRFRMTGSANPRSGPALTVGIDF